MLRGRNISPCAVLLRRPGKRKVPSAGHKELPLHNYIKKPLSKTLSLMSITLIVPSTRQVPFHELLCPDLLKHHNTILQLLFLLFSRLLVTEQTPTLCCFPLKISSSASVDFMTHGHYTKYSKPSMY